MSDVTRGEQAPLPFASGVLYANPNPDGSQKSCRNCFMWVAGENRCIIHPPEVEVMPAHICGYHVFGMPLERWAEIPGLDPVDPALSGLELVGEGTVCGTCVYYEPTGRGKGLCYGVAGVDRYPPQPVQLMGCCARWEGREA